MKKALLILQFCLSGITSSLAQQWHTPYFVMSIDAQWISPDPDESGTKTASGKEGIDLIKFVKIIRSETGSSGIMILSVFETQNKAGLRLPDVVAENILAGCTNVRISSGLPCKNRKTIVKVNDKGVILDYYTSVWYIQGKDRVYKIEFGSYENNLFLKYNTMAENTVKSFLEKSNDEHSSYLAINTGLFLHLN
jgi:hypothetical protein